MCPYVFDECKSMCKFVCICLSVNVGIYESVSVLHMCERVCDVWVWICVYFEGMCLYECVHRCVWRCMCACDVLGEPEDSQLKMFFICPTSSRFQDVVCGGTEVRGQKRKTVSAWGVGDWVA